MQRGLEKSLSRTLRATGERGPLTYEGILFLDAAKPVAAGKECIRISVPIPQQAVEVAAQANLRERDSKREEREREREREGYLYWHRGFT